MLLTTGFIIYLFTIVKYILHNVMYLSNRDIMILF